MRDMTKKQFVDALQRHNLKPEGFMGYVNLGIPAHHVCVSIHNAGTNRRAQLTYLLRERDRYEKKFDQEQIVLPEPDRDSKNHL